MGSYAAATRLKCGPSIDPHQPMLAREWQTEYALMTALHDDISDLVEQQLRRALETGETVNVPDLASKSQNTDDDQSVQRASHLVL